MNNRVLVVDYEVGNHLSVTNALARLGYSFIVSNKVSDIVNADSYILPGVGSFGEAMKNLHRLNLVDILNEQVLVRKKPVLGICLGMQIMALTSEENGLHKGLCWVEGKVVKLKAHDGFRVPHVGWDSLEIIKKDPLYLSVDDEPNFYFNHSYHFIPTREDRDERFITATCRPGEDITASFQKDNVFGVQFHPEKSQRCGLKLFRSFFNHIGQRASHVQKANHCVPAR